MSTTVHYTHRFSVKPKTRDQKGTAVAWAIWDQTGRTWGNHEYPTSQEAGKAYVALMDYCKAQAKPKTKAATKPKASAKPKPRAKAKPRATTKKAA